ALHEQGVTAAGRRPQDAPVAAAGGGGLAPVGAQPQERVFSDQDQLMRVDVKLHRTGSSQSVMPGAAPVTSAALSGRSGGASRVPAGGGLAFRYVVADRPSRGGPRAFSSRLLADPGALSGGAFSLPPGLRPAGEAVGPEAAQRLWPPETSSSRRARVSY